PCLARPKISRAWYPVLASASREKALLVFSRFQTASNRLCSASSRASCNRWELAVHEQQSAALQAVQKISLAVDKRMPHKSRAGARSLRDMLRLCRVRPLDF